VGVGTEGVGGRVEGRVVVRVEGCSRVVGEGVCLWEVVEGSALLFLVVAVSDKVLQSGKDRSHTRCEEEEWWQAVLVERD
jgi:hypothetical protein